MPGSYLQGLITLLQQGSQLLNTSLHVTHL
jgi:hypothetical protein